MHRNYFLVIVAVAIFCLILIFTSLWFEIAKPIVKNPSNPPPAAPFKTFISGVGIVEASSENILINTTLNRTVESIIATVGSKVKKGEVLLTLDNRDLKSTEAVQAIAYKTALLKLQRLEAFPRPEDLLVANANLRSAEAAMNSSKVLYEMVQGLPDPRSISQQEKDRRQFNYQQAEAKYQEVKADHDKIQQGTWKPDLELAKLEVEEAAANLNHTKSEINRTIIMAPRDATVLQIRIHEGEFPSPDGSRSPMMVLGDISQLYLRVSINQYDIPHFSPKAHAIAYLQGDSKARFSLEFVRVEPFLVNKQNLTNEITEKIDTKVLQIVYKIKNEERPIYVGQQMDVFIETDMASK